MGKKQVKKLFYDIERVIEGETKRHFIGIIEEGIVKTDFIFREREVVDG